MLKWFQQYLEPGLFIQAVLGRQWGGPVMRKPILAGIALLATASHASGPKGTYVTIPETIPTESGAPLPVERGLFFVPENRRDPASRVIAVQFLRFKAVAAPAGDGIRPPVVLLAGGPGSEFDFTGAKLQRAVERMRRTRDVIYISQRGNPRARGLVPALWVENSPEPLNEPASAERTRAGHRQAVGQAIDKWSAQGVDLAGYDILNIVDDVYELRAALGYDKIVLRGCSFGSQWSFSYIKRWPQTVDRALLSGVEPLDYAYDSPKWLWASMARMAEHAQADSRVAAQLPRGGLMKAIQTIIERLEKQPVTATIEDPKSGEKIAVTLGADDLRAELPDAAGFPGASHGQRLANWPRFVTEIFNGDYSYLAVKRWKARTQPSQDTLITALIDNSLGITAQRDAKLRAEPEARWLGDINDFYHDTRDLTPTPNVGDAFRADWRIEAPVLLVNGDWDWSTPVENARHARKFLAHGHLMVIEGATHCSEVPELADKQPQAAESLYAFLDEDFGKTTPEAFFATVPRKATYLPREFAPLSGPSLYEQWRAQSAR
jgi:pimeloyl-ACP methyl ester carboxylesterase